MKKLLIISFVLFLGSLYLYTTGRDEKYFSPLSQDIINSTTAEGTSSLNKIKIKRMRTESKSLSISEEKFNDLESKYDRVESEWNEKIKELFKKGKIQKIDDLDAYTLLQKKMANEKLREQENFHKLLEQKYGTNYSYNPTEEDEYLRKKVDLKYQKALLELIGKTKYIKYLEIKDKFNQNQMKQPDPIFGPILMEF